MKNIIIIDNNPMVCNSIAEELTLDSYTTCSNFSNPQSTLAILTPKIATASLIIFDFDLYNLDVFNFMKKLITENQQIPSLFYASNKDSIAIKPILAWGICGMVFKTDPIQDFIEAVKLCSKGEFYYNKEAKNILLQFTIKKSAIKTSGLTNKELEIIKYACKGYKIDEIATLTNSNSRAVGNSKYKIKQKLQLQNAKDIVAYAHRNGLS